MLTHTRKRLVLVALILVVLTGLILVWLTPHILSIVFDDFVGVQLARVMDTTVVRELNYVDGDFGGPHVSGSRYALSFDVPESWVHEVRTHINGPTLVFEYLLGENEHRVSPDVAVSIFGVNALASETYQEELRDPWFDGVVVQTDDTVFIWYMHPVHSPDLTQAEIEVVEELQSDVPAILESVELIPLN